MRTSDDIESFLIDSQYAYERLSPTMWRVHDEDDDAENIVIYVTDTIINFQVQLFELPKKPSAALLTRLLELNGSDIIHGAYAISGDHVIIIGALELDNLDRNEIQAMINSMGLAVTEHYSELSALIA